MGLQILGWTMVIVGLIVDAWGVVEFPVSEFLKSDFLSFAVSGVVLIAGGLAVLKMPAWLTIAAIIAATILLALFIWNFRMGIANTLISYVIMLAIVGWLISLLLK
ncbi:hypothetical protein LQF61_06980 [Tetragenococcus koreensis]|uniref:hypothetical protein n=1 Tax=Tetragenococcus koreensis TaxID=290335 RepID=UPI001F28175B|nr:hypothetical protein [Tetragenococcus koreensis]MCF1584418.1 hypothetical protein [Tetragenococcus koreensis]MCF1613967.1 hypothetical protein [Tetragenococcus koreensis]MCF1619818.1 hypothetical protein [Tetragenococcus koreensis]MCF1623747.1 hypothetical protein [Tetragenococcus koreensis]MCF1628656.1 hypothetical protein [Tetragenococcus koreensis]